MATTTGGTTYVTSTDLVANYPTASLALANRTDVVASGGPVLVKTAGYTITVADILAGNKFLYNSASPGTFTLPTSSLVDGMVVDVSQIGAGALTVSGGTIVGTTVTTAQYQGLRFVYVASGTTWYSIAPNATAPGLASVAPTSTANTGGSVSVSGGAVTLTGVSSVSLNGCFSSTYANYRIVMALTGTTASASYTYLRFRASGTDTSSNYSYAGYNDSSGGAARMYTVSQSAGILSLTGDVNSGTAFDVISPQLAFRTHWMSANSGWGTSGGGSLTINGVQFTDTVYDGITIYPSSGTLTGVIRVYGYKNS